MQFTGERYVPALKGQIHYEHLHRYAIAAGFSAGKRVLDIASGEGYGAALLARTAAEVVGVDNDAAAIEHARAAYYAQNLRFVRGEATDIPLPDASVDVIACFETIEHVEGHERLLDELRRVLVPDGVLLVSSPNKLVYSDAANYENPFHVKELYYADLRDLLMRRFRHVALYGQRLSASSVVHPLAGAVSRHATWYSGDARGMAHGLPALDNPVYFLCICSDAPLDADLSSAYVDPSDDLLHDLDQELVTLRHQAARTLPAPDAVVALPPGSADGDGALEERLVREREEAVRAAEAAGEEHAAALRAEVAALRDELAAARDELSAERERAAHAAEEHAAEVARVRAAFTTRATDVAGAHESEVRAMRARLDAESEASRLLVDKLETVESEARASRDALAGANAALHDERLRGERLMQQIVELRAAENARETRAAGEAQDALRAAHEDADRLRAQLAAGAEEANALRAQAAAAAEETNVLRAQLAAMADALRDAQNVIAAYNDMVGSRSWKMTEPLRRAGQLLRR